MRTQRLLVPPQALAREYTDKDDIADLPPQRDEQSSTTNSTPNWS